MYGVVKVSKWSREGQRSPSDFLRWFNGELILKCLLLPRVTSRG